MLQACLFPAIFGNPYPLHKNLSTAKRCLSPTIINEMLKSILLTGFCFLFISGVQAQMNDPEESPINYFNTSQRFIYEELNIDSAIFYIRKLASKPTYNNLLKDFIHNSFAQAFIQRTALSTDTAEANRSKVRSAYCIQVLQKIVSDTTQLLKETAKPLWLWVQVQQAGVNTSTLKALAEVFIKEDLSPEVLYANKTGRYALLIYPFIAAQPVLKPLADSLFTQVFIYLRNNQLAITDSSKRSELEKRAWNRYLYAYMNYTKAGSTDDEQEKETLLKTAFDYSPDLTDRNHKAAYFYDMVFLFGGTEKDEFKDNYLAFLMHSNRDSKTVLPVLLQQALVEPSYKKKLKAYYDSRAINTTTSFNNYWMNAVNATAVHAPPVLLQQINKKLFSSKQLSGKWILLDFWGTWCGPCREEHPDLQQFYKTVVLKRPESISLLTIACRDIETKVTKYISDKKFSFPVAMSDNKIEDQYKVQGYPTKILITPAGKYIIVPFGIDWVSFVKQYAAL